MESDYAPVQNGRLYYEVAGSGPMIVLIHAGFLVSRLWDEPFDLFSKFLNRQKLKCSRSMIRATNLNA